MGWAHNPVWTHTKHASEEQKSFKKLLTVYQNCDTITTKDEGKENPKNQKGNETYEEDFSADSCEHSGW